MEGEVEEREWRGGWGRCKVSIQYNSIQEHTIEGKTRSELS